MCGVAKRGTEAYGIFINLLISGSQPFKNLGTRKTNIGHDFGFSKVLCSLYNLNDNMELWTRVQFFSRNLYVIPIEKPCCPTLTRWTSSVCPLRVDRQADRQAAAWAGGQLLLVIMTNKKSAAGATTSPTSLTTTTTDISENIFVLLLLHDTIFASSC